MSESKGNVFGIFAILIWSSLGVLGVFANNVPPFFMLFVCFFIASILGLIYCKIKSCKISTFKQKPKVYLVGIIGLFGYHFFYFFAIKNAPSVEANLINYLWPLLIVLFSAFLPDNKLQKHHIIGAIFGFLGAFFLIGLNANFKVQFLFGYASAIIAAVFWSSYSVISRTFKNVSSTIILPFCMATCVLSLLAHLIFEPNVNLGISEVFALVGLGLGPVGGAFYLWDIAVKNGDIKLLGTLAYFVPLLSTFLLIFFTSLSANPYIYLACFFIISGSLISAKVGFKG